MVKIQRLFAKTNLKIPVYRIRSAKPAPQETKNSVLKKRIFYMENPLKSRDFSGFSGPSDWFRTSGLVVPNRNRKLFLDVSNGFLSFPLVFRYSRTLFGTPISACSARVCSNPCGQKRFPTKKTGSVFYVQSVCIVTPGRGLCKWFLRGRQFKDCGAIDKEYNHLVYTLSTW